MEDDEDHAKRPEHGWPTYPRPEKLPKPQGGVISQIVELIGRSAALDLVERMGGVRVHIPVRTAKGDSVLASVIGVESARNLQAAFSGIQIKIPLAKEWRLTVYHLAGCSQSEIARYLCMDESAVQRTLKSLGQTDALTGYSRGIRSKKRAMARREAWKAAAAVLGPAAAADEPPAKIGDLKPAPADQVRQVGHLNRIKPKNLRLDRLGVSVEADDE